LQKLKPKQEYFLMALISEPSITKAIEKSGIAKNTAYRYLKDRNFFSEYQKLRQDMIGRTTSLLLQASGQSCTRWQMIQKKAPTQEYRQLKQY